MAVITTKSQELALQRAEALTRKQIEMALRLNAELFKDGGLEHLPPILQALSSNYHASVVWARNE